MMNERGIVDKEGPTFWGADFLTIAGWWFQLFFIFTPTWDNDPI